jgi:hypothetical protein
MSKIENHSIFGNYKQVENRVTAALLQIFKIGGTNFIGNVISQIDEIDFPSSEINIVTQEREKSNVYDGLLECNFSFRVLVESKIELGDINKEQLRSLIKNACNETDYILYITPHGKKPKTLCDKDKNISWVNWKDLNTILTNYDTENEVLCFLIQEFEKFIDFLNLLEIDNPENRVQIVAGSYGEPKALQYGFYACQNHRSRKNSRYLAFYNKSKINTLFEIIGEPLNDCNLLELNDVKMKEYLSKYEPNYTYNDKRQFYRLKLIKENLNIKHDKRNANGKKVAYTMGVFRYTNIDKLYSAKTTEDL